MPVSPLALTMGEPSGIGGEIALLAWMGCRQSNLPAFFLLDDPTRLETMARHFGWPVPIHVIAEPGEAATHFAAALPVLPLNAPVACRPGQPDPGNAAAILESIARAVELAAAGQALGVVTNPIHKANLAAAGFKHPGHTEFLAELAGGAAPVMMLAAPGLRVVPVTVHIPLCEVSKRLTADAILRQGIILDESLRRDFKLAAPRIAVAGLNPHAGEEGVLGVEEETIIRPAVKTLRSRGIDAFGPLPADTLFHEEARRGYDAVMCMYHDQALIPLKMLGFWEGVNATLGLPFVRTSPDHGTALSLAGSGKADPRSLMAALRMAAQMANARAGAA